MKKRFVFLSIAFVLATGMLHLFAQTTTQPGTITVYVTGWFADQVRVQTTAPFVNPANCPNHDGYLTNPSDPANVAHQAALLGALLAGKTIAIQVLDTQCYIGRPQVLGVIAYP